MNHRAPDNRFMFIWLHTIIRRAPLYVTKYFIHIIIGIAWLLTLLVLYNYLIEENGSLLAVVLALFTFVTTSAWGPFLYLGAYAIRPLAFFPATGFAIFAGVFFGFWLGLVLTLIGATISATMAYVIGRTLSSDSKNIHIEQMSSWRSFLLKNPFETTLFLHLTFMPFDAMNYFAGLLRIGFVQFIFGTFLGSIPGASAFVSIGASVDLKVLMEDGVSISIFDPFYLFLAAAIFTVSLLISRLIKSYRNGLLN